MGSGSDFSINPVDLANSDGVSVKRNTFDITLTAKLSGYSNTFNMFPFSTKYGGVEIQADDGSGENHTSKNKNQWVVCDATKSGSKILITYPTQGPHVNLRSRISKEIIKMDFPF